MQQSSQPGQDHSEELSHSSHLSRYEPHNKQSNPFESIRVALDGMRNDVWKDLEHIENNPPEKEEPGHVSFYERVRQNHNSDMFASELQSL